MNNVKKSIGWADFTINPVKGLCPMACSYCYARRMYKRFKWNPEIRYNAKPFVNLMHKPASKVFVGSTMELFGEWINPIYLRDIFALTQWDSLKQHTFIFLTKKPEMLFKFNPYPPNCYIGASVTNQSQFFNAIGGLYVTKAPVRFISFEPLLERIEIKDSFKNIVDWIISGQCTPIKESTRPKSEWIQEIIDAADKAQIPIFIKDNILNDKELHWLKGDWNRREFPQVE